MVGDYIRKGRNYSGRLVTTALWRSPIVVWNCLRFFRASPNECRQGISKEMQNQVNCLSFSCSLPLKFVLFWPLGITIQGWSVDHQLLGCFHGASWRCGNYQPAAMEPNLRLIGMGAHWNWTCLLSLYKIWYNMKNAICYDDIIWSNAIYSSINDWLL